VSQARQALGALGERIAARWMERQGWRIVARRFRSGHRDLDLVACRGGAVAFVEVKARRSGEVADPTAAVGWRKRRELVRSAQVWIDRHGPPSASYRFDVVAVLLGPGRRVRVRHLEDAFMVPERQR
jgi:putative endonuclease